MNVYKVPSAVFSMNIFNIAEESRFAHQYSQLLFLVNNGSFKIISSKDSWLHHHFRTPKLFQLLQSWIFTVYSVDGTNLWISGSLPLKLSVKKIRKKFSKLKRTVLIEGGLLSGIFTFYIIFWSSEFSSGKPKNHHLVFEKTFEKYASVKDGKTFIFRDWTRSGL